MKFAIPQAMAILFIVVLISPSCYNNNKAPHKQITADSTEHINLIVPDHPDSIKMLAEEFTPKEIYLEILQRNDTGRKDTLPPDILLNYTREEIQYIEKKNERLKGLNINDLIGLYQFSFEGRKVIYGADDREDVIYDTSNIYDIGNQPGTPPDVSPFMKDGRFVVVMIPKTHMGLDPSSGNYVITQKRKFRQVYTLCETERFLDQPVVAQCSGFAAGPDRIVTAGHCADPSTFRTFYYVFDLILDSLGNFNPIIPARNVYEGVELFSEPPSREKDYAVIKVNRTIPSYRIPEINYANNLSPSTQFHVIGSPCGLPLKIAYNASLRNNNNPNFFTITSDTYGGNSGSPVFNSATHKVEGILVRGEDDFKTIEVKSKFCRVSLVCPFNGCRGEDVSRAIQFSRFIK